MMNYLNKTKRCAHNAKLCVENAALTTECHTFCIVQHEFDRCVGWMQNRKGGYKESPHEIAIHFFYNQIRLRAMKYG